LKRENSLLEEQIRHYTEELAVERSRHDRFDEQVDEEEKRMAWLRGELEAKYLLLVKKVIPHDDSNVEGCREIASAIVEIRERFEEWARYNKVNVDELLETVKIDESYVAEIAGYREEGRKLRLQLKILEEELFNFENHNIALNKDLLDLHFELKTERRQYEESLSKLMPRIQFYVNENISFHEKIRSLLDTNVSLRAELEQYKSLVKSGNDNLDSLQRNIASLALSGAVFGSSADDSGHWSRASAMAGGTSSYSSFTSSYEGVNRSWN